MLQIVAKALHEGTTRALRLALEGQSVKIGRLPTWLENATDFTLQKLKTGSTVLVVDFPTLGSVAPDQIVQQDLWDSVPDPKETAMSVLSKSIKDAAAQQFESDRYDTGILDSILSFHKDLVSTKTRIEVRSKIRRADHFRLDEREMQTIAAVRKKVPEPQTVVLSGFLNMIEHSERKFSLTTIENQSLKGRISESTVSIESLRLFWGKQVTVKGTLYYHASGTPRLLEAHQVLKKQSGDEVFAQLPIPRTLEEETHRLYIKYHQQDLYKQLWGEWPGEEPIEELLNSLKE
jgi:hypothetical protein